jgi:outer membrane protein assembly factor BamB
VEELYLNEGRERRYLVGKYAVGCNKRRTVRVGPRKPGRTALHQCRGAAECGSTDQDGTVWSGTSTGVIHVLDPDNGTWLYIQDIAATNQTNKQINRIVVYGDTVFICTEFGLSIFRRRLSEFGDTFTKFGTLPTNVRIRVLDAAVYDGKLWAAVSDGQGNDRIAVADLSNPNLLPPESWTLQTVGSPPATPTGFRPFNGRLYAGTTTGLFVLEGAGWVALPTLSGANVVSTVAYPSLLAL